MHPSSARSPPRHPGGTILMLLVDDGVCSSAHLSLQPHNIVYTLLWCWVENTTFLPHRLYYYTFLSELYHYIEMQRVHAVDNWVSPRSLLFTKVKLETLCRGPEEALLTCKHMLQIWKSCYNLTNLRYSIIVPITLVKCSVH